jgi:hypothetical protein
VAGWNAVQAAAVGHWSGPCSAHYATASRITTIRDTIPILEPLLNCLQVTFLPRLAGLRSSAYGYYSHDSFLIDFDPAEHLTATDTSARFCCEHRI